MKRRAIRVVGNSGYTASVIRPSAALPVPATPLAFSPNHDERYIQRGFCGPRSIRREGKVSSIVLPLVLVFTLLAPVRALAWSENPTTPEGWAWKQIKAGNLADFNDHCGATLDPHKPDGWDAPCRQIPAQFFVDILTMPKWQNQITRHRIPLRGAHVVGEVDLSNAEIVSGVWLEASLIAGNIDLTNAHLKRSLSFDGSVLGGVLFADRMDAESVITMRDATFASDVRLVGVRVGSDLQINTAAFSKTLSADDLDVHDNLFMADATFAGYVSLRGAKVGGVLAMNRASFSKTLSADRLDVHGALFMRDHATFAGDVSLIAATAGWLDLSSATVAGIDLSDMSGAAGSELQLTGLNWRCRETGTQRENSGTSQATVKEGTNKWPLGEPSWRKARCKSRTGWFCPNRRRPGSAH
jgi:hypothetical protein